MCYVDRVSNWVSSALVQVINIQDSQQHQTQGINANNKTTKEPKTERK